MTRERFRGAMLGLAVGDAVGTSVEFKRPGTFEPVTEMVGGGPFSLPVGAWTDDTSMALCLAESLIECRKFDPVDQLERYVRWWKHGHLSSTGHCFDIGIATQTALADFMAQGEPYPGDGFPDAGGNGALMRLAPVPLVWSNDARAAIKFAGLSGRTTHGKSSSTDSCRYYSGLMVAALNDSSKEDLLSQEPFDPTGAGWSEANLDREVLEVARGSYREKQPPEISGNGYVVDSLEAALWALARTESFQDGVLAVVNLGDDADTTGAIYGQLAGAIYGVEGIPDRWLEKVVMRGEIESIADRLLDLSEEITDE